MTGLIELQNGDLISIENILYVHPSKTEEAAYLYIKQLFHSLEEKVISQNTIKAKMIKITLDDYELIRKYCVVYSSDNK